MCGIAGYIGSQVLDVDQVNDCLHLMNRRGPDDQSYMRWETPQNQIYFLHSRLKIIDTNNRANQPFKVGSKWLIFNGELYNYLEIKQELLHAGRRFKTDSDTEVLAQAIDHHRWGILDRLEGMWAFAVYDESDGSIHLCRDRFGEKPLFIYEDDRGLYFGSEIKFIQALLNERLKINYDHLCRYLVNGYKSLYKKQEFFFHGISELPRGGLLKFLPDRSYEQKSYWKPSICINDGMTEEEAVSGVRDHLIRSMELRLRADVPLAFCMSGGVDSNSLISIAKRIFDYDVHGFTIVSEDERYAEMDEVELSVKDLGIRHSSVPVSHEEFIPKLHTLIGQHDAPVYTITYFAHWQLMEKVAEHGYKISISGTAADELFTGYFDHHLLYLHDIQECSDLYHTSVENWKRYIKPTVRNPFLQNPSYFIGNSKRRDHVYLNADDFASFLIKPWQERFTEEHYSPFFLRNRMLNELFHEATPVILHEDDHNAMYYSIENRSPFLDRNLLSLQIVFLLNI